MIISSLILIFILIPTFVLLLGFLTYSLTILRVSKDKTVIAEYQSPKLLAPPELGYLIDHRFGNNELIATILELNNKGFLNIIKLKNDLGISLNEKDGAHNLTSPEIAVIGWLKSGHKKEVKLSKLISKKNGFAGINSSFRSEVKSDLRLKGYLYGNSNLLFWDRQSRAGRIALFVSLLCSIVLSIFLYTILTDPSEANIVKESIGNIDSMLTILTVALCFIPLLFSLNLYFRLLAIIYSVPAGYPRDYTDSLVNIWDDVAGFRLFIRTVEFSRLDAGVKITDPVLPYAVALGYKLKLDKLEI